MFVDYMNEIYTHDVCNIHLSIEVFQPLKKAIFPHIGLRNLRHKHRLNLFSKNNIVIHNFDYSRILLY